MPLSDRDHRNETFVGGWLNDSFRRHPKGHCLPASPAVPSLATKVAHLKVSIGPFRLETEGLAVGLKTAAGSVPNEGRGNKCYD